MCAHAQTHTRPCAHPGELAEVQTPSRLGRVCFSLWCWGSTHKALEVFEMKRKGLHPCCTHSAAGRLLPAEPAMARASRNVTEGESEEGVVLWGRGGSSAVTGDPEQGAEAAWRSRGPRASSICSLHCLLSGSPDLDTGHQNDCPLDTPAPTCRALSLTFKCLLTFPPASLSSCWNGVLGTVSQGLQSSGSSSDLVPGLML